MQRAVERAVTYAEGPGFRIEILDDTHAMVEFMAKGKCGWHRYEIRLNRIHGDFELLKQKLWVIATTRAAWFNGVSPTGIGRGWLSLPVFWPLDSLGTHLPYVEMGATRRQN